MKIFRTILDIPKSVLDVAESIKLDNYKTNHPKEFRKETVVTDDGLYLMAQLSSLTGVPVNKLDYVYFSACRGADEHVDLLDPEKFEDVTYIIPLVLPSGKSILHEDGYSTGIQVGGVYEINHTKPHSLDLEDTESGCTLIMVAICR